MRLGELAKLNRLADERKRLIDERAQIRSGHGLGVFFNGTPLIAETLELIRPVIVGDLSGRIRRVDQELVDLGVDLT